MTSSTCCYPTVTSQRNLVGSPTEVALLKFVENFESIEYFRSNLQIIHEIPFNSTRKWHLIIVRRLDCDDDETSDTCTYTMMMKGAPEMLLGRCTTMATTNDDDDDVVTIDESALFRFKVNRTNRFGFKSIIVFVAGRVSSIWQ
jgi:magnesium-transporting ATPase (P-type)